MLLGAGSGNLKPGSLTLNPIHRRRRSLSQSQLLDLGGKSHHHHHHLHHLNNHHQGLFGKVPTTMGLFDNPVGSNQPSHGTSAGFCNICKKLVSNRTNHKYVHSQVKFRCKLCGYLYSRKDTLKDHIRGKHNPRYSTSDLNSLVEVVPPAPNSPNLGGTSSSRSPNLVGVSPPKSPNLVVPTPPVPSALTTIADALMKSSHEAKAAAAAAAAENVTA